MFSSSVIRTIGLVLLIIIGLVMAYWAIVAGVLSLTVVGLAIPFWALIFVILFIRLKIVKKVRKGG